jgi:hypothetical protein
MLLNTTSEEFAATENNNAQYTQYCTAGKRVLAPVGFVRGASSMKGTPYIEVGFVCVEDLDDKGEAGHVTTRKFWITESAVKQFGKFLVSLGFRAQIDTDVDEDVDRALSNGYTKAFLKTETYTKRDGSEGSSSSPAFFDPCPNEQPEWEDFIVKAQDWWEGYVSRQQSRSAGQAQSAPAAFGDASTVPF